SMRANRGSAPARFFGGDTRRPAATLPRPPALPPPALPAALLGAPRPLPARGSAAERVEPAAVPPPVCVSVRPCRGAWTSDRGAPGMDTNFSNRLQATLLAVATVGLVLLAIWNFRQESHFLQPDDGIWWSEAPAGTGLIAQKVLDASPGQRAGIKTNDLLTEV